MSLYLTLRFKNWFEKRPEHRINQEHKNESLIVLVVEILAAPMEVFGRRKETKLKKWLEGLDVFNSVPAQYLLNGTINLLYPDYNTAW
jgi:hypothetical protein